MTRINLIHPSALADQHLFAEWREIKHIPAFLKQKLEKCSKEELLPLIPKRFTLNKGHKYFFIDKIVFLDIRYRELSAELIKRGYELNKESYDKWDFWAMNTPNDFLNNYDPTMMASLLSMERIIERLNEKPGWYRYYGEIKDIEFFKDLMDKSLQI